MMRAPAAAPMTGLPCSPCRLFLPPVPQLPGHFLPAPLRGWLERCCRAHAGPPGISGHPCHCRPPVSSSGTLSASLQNERGDWLESPNLWGGTIRRSGFIKHPSAQQAIKPLVQIEMEERTAYGAHREAHQVSSAQPWRHA